MRDDISIGSVPWDEECEQLGPNYDPSLARAECVAFIHQLRRMFGPEPTGAHLMVKSNPHDFGNYLEVICRFETDFPDSLEYALKCESEGPDKWDDAALVELGKEKYLKRSV